MEFLFIFAAMLTAEAAWFVVARKRNRREIFIRQLLSSIEFERQVRVKQSTSDEIEYSR